MAKSKFAGCLLAAGLLIAGLSSCALFKPLERTEYAEGWVRFAPIDSIGDYQIGAFISGGNWTEVNKKGASYLYGVIQSNYFINSKKRVSPNSIPRLEIDSIYLLFDGGEIKKPISLTKYNKPYINIPDFIQRYEAGFRYVDYNNSGAPSGYGFLIQLYDKHNDSIIDSRYIAQDLDVFSLPAYLRQETSPFYGNEWVISLPVSDSGRDCMVIEDIAGNTIDTIISKNTPPGYYYDRGIGYKIDSSGVYFFDLYLDGEKIDRKKFVILK